MCSCWPQCNYCKDKNRGKFREDDIWAAESVQTERGCNRASEETHLTYCVKFCSLCLLQLFCQIIVHRITPEMHTGTEPYSRTITGLTVSDVSLQTCIFEEVHVTLFMMTPACVQALKWRLWRWNINQALQRKLLEHSDCSVIIKSNMMHPFCSHLVH